MMVCRRKYLWVLIIVVLILSATLTACNYRKGWVEMTYPDRIRATYELFIGQNGTTVGLKAGEKMALDYDLEITKGSLTLRVVDPGRDVVWEEDFESDTMGSISIPAEIEGKYRLIVTGDETQGGFDLQWVIIEND